MRCYATQSESSPSALFTSLALAGCRMRTRQGSHCSCQATSRCSLRIRRHGPSGEHVRLSRTVLTMLDLGLCQPRLGLHNPAWSSSRLGRAVFPQLSALQYVCTSLKTQYTVSCHLNDLSGHGRAVVGSGGAGVLLLAWAACSSADIQKACASIARAFRPFCELRLRSRLADCVPRVVSRSLPTYLRDAPAASP
ncbi:hypothetical protein OH76DRAFT_178434 [Lentinus brumalis]|uniref:Uncharacterized protein n=1 Tax=Lentinus brumalis TaxID=2498619 RepID=A0A371CNH6_9APHY|nr:hypothetical protein OH76DRAFT_178434 [Polyporus brumalis]